MNKHENKLNVVIFEDNTHLRDSLSILVGSSGQFECIGAYADTRNLLKNIGLNTPDLVIMDIEMPGMNGIEATRLIKQHYPQIRILILTVFDDDDKIFQSLCAGGSGYLLKSSTPEQILQGLRDVNNSGASLSPAVAERMVRFFQNNISFDAPDYSLTSKERELLHHMVDGKSYKMIGDAMKISLETVKYHIKNIYRKLHVNSSSEAVVKAIRQNIV
jgi:DNA-binding NarL/FixJ family response regulator